MSRLITASAAVLALWSTIVLAEPPATKPMPGPEHQRLGYFVGNWRSEGTINPNPFMPAGGFSSDDRCTWFEGGFAVVCNSTGSSPMGPTVSLGIMGYSTEEKVYTYLGAENSPMAMTSVPRGSVKDGAWVYEDQSKMGGKLVKFRYLINESSPTSYSFKWEMLGDDGRWQTVVEGKSMKK